MACLGLSLLITRSRLARRALGPLAAAGAMTLTLYTGHVIVQEATSFLEDHPIQLFFVLVYIAVSFAALWRRGGRQGPLEAAVTWASAGSSRLVESHSPTKSDQTTTGQASRLSPNHLNPHPRGDIRLVEFAGFTGPLTLLENGLRQRAGEAG